MNTFEDRLLAELKAVVAERAGQPGPARRDKLGRLAGQRWRPRGLVAVGLTASLALGGVLAGTELAASDAPPTPRYSLVADFLNQAAAAARTQTVVQPGPGQLYVTLTYGIGDMIVLKNGHLVHDTSCDVSWYNHVGRPIMTIVWPAKPSDLQCKDVSVKSPGKRFAPEAGHWYPPPASLSHDPRTLLEQLDSAAGRGAAYWTLRQVRTQPTRNQIAFTLVERLLQAPISDDLRAALYQATIGIPGVQLKPDAVDALGRVGTGVSMRLPVGGASSYTSEFILAKRTFAFLGTSSSTPGGIVPEQDAFVRSVIVPADGA